MTGPSIASDPATANAIRSQRLALNNPWVKRRWKPTVIPWPATAYMTVAITMSCQPRPRFQATGIAARIARNGMAMKTNKAPCSSLPLRSNWGIPPASRTDVESPRIEVSSAWGWTVSAWVAETEVVIDGALRCRETYASVTFAPVGCWASAAIAWQPSGSTTLARAPRRRVVPRVVCWQGPPDFESGVATKVRFLPGEPRARLRRLRIGLGTGSNGPDVTRRPARRWRHAGYRPFC